MCYYHGGMSAVLQVEENKYQNLPQESVGGKDVC